MTLIRIKMENENIFKQELFNCRITCGTGTYNKEEIRCGRVWSSKSSACKPTISNTKKISSVHFDQMGLHTMQAPLSISKPSKCFGRKCSGRLKKVFKRGLHFFFDYLRFPHPIYPYVNGFF